MGWRTKFVFVLIVYAAGFATAVYYLAPTPNPSTQSPEQLARLVSAQKAQELLKSFNSGMHKCVGFSKEAAKEAAKLIQAKFEEINKAASSG
jgi:predicted MFS family arabinose efflux permease